MNPTFMPEGNVVEPADTKRRTWAKICGSTFDNTAGADASLAPRSSDTLRILKAKTDYLLASTTSTF